MPTSSQIPIRLQLQLASNPPVEPIDRNTGKAPQFFRGEDVAIDIGIFNGGASVDLTNLANLQVAIYPWPIRNNADNTTFKSNPFSTQPFPNNPPAPLQFVTIPAAQITKTITVANWEQGLAQQARAVFSFIQTGGLNLNGQPSAPFLLGVRGMTSAGALLQYGQARLQVFESGQNRIYLPNNLAPLDVPAPSILYIPPNQQMIFHQPIKIEGSVVVDGGVLVQV